MIFRKFEPNDRDEVRRICMDTAKGRFAVKPVLREIVANMFIDYNIDFEPQNCIIAYDGEVCGYCAYGTDLDLLKKQTDEVYAPRVSKKNFIYAQFLKTCVKTSVKLGKKYKGGGFHLNVAKSSQGKSVGPKLLTLMGLHLRNLGYKFMYLVTENRKTRGYGFYRNFGFEEAEKCGLGTLCLIFDLSLIDEKIKKYNLEEYKYKEW